MTLLEIATLYEHVLSHQSDAGCITYFVAQKDTMPSPIKTGQSKPKDSVGQRLLDSQNNDSDIQERVLGPNVDSTPAKQVADNNLPMTVNGTVHIPSSVVPETNIEPSGERRIEETFTEQAVMPVEARPSIAKRKRVAQEAANFLMQVEPRRSKRGRSGEDNTLAFPEQSGNSPLDEPKPIKKGRGWVIVPV
ncbi:hypothetical protein M422DRAFT_276494 [Sphaerobolus stellatus SS14]|uniref:Uncharacterized protein n=1 Tax=Sphaerobolus stellatus (strain SS14) TaxID=990650 RepID=A0A0C9UC41_SPHS4|nr:hypothetical protein M422DRAFT_276494 [Sphaerobolus stellatus SS14]